MNPLITPLAATGAVLYASNPLLLAAVQKRNPQYNAVRDPVSDYGVGSARPLFQVYGLVGTAAAALLAVLMWLAGLPGPLVVMQVGVMLMRVGVMQFPTDLEGAPRTTAGLLHMVAAVGSFALTYAVIDKATPLLAATTLPALAGALQTLRYTAALGLVALVAGLLLRPVRSVFGLAERVFLIALPVWGLLACLAVATAH